MSALDEDLVELTTASVSICHSMLIGVDLSQVMVELSEYQKAW